MTIARVRVGDVLRLERREVEVDPTASYTLAGVYSFGKGLFHHEPKKGLELGNYRFFRVQAGDLVLSNIGAWEGGIAFARSYDEGLVGNQRLMTYVANDDRIDPNWARWFLISEPGMTLIGRATPGTVMRNRTLAIDRFEALQIPLPPIDEQRRVAQHLDGVEAAAVELGVKTALADAISDALCAAIALRPDLGDADKARAGWVRCHLGDVLTEQTESVPVDPSSVYPTAGVYSFGRGMFARPELSGSRTSYRAFNRLRSNQVVMSRLKAWEGAITIVPAEYDGWFLSPEFPTFAVNQERVDVGYLQALITSQQFWTRLAGSSRGIGARRERVPAARLLDQEIVLPPLCTQQSTAKLLVTVAAVGERRLIMRGHIDALVSAALNEAFVGLS